MDLDLSNTDKSIKYLKEIMIPYVENKRKDNKMARAFLRS